MPLKFNDRFSGLLSVACLLLSLNSLAEVSVENTLIRIQQLTLENDILIVTADEPLIEPAACVDTNKVNQFSFDINTDSGRVMHTLLITAMNANMPFEISRPKDCADSAGVERIDGISIKDDTAITVVNALELKQDTLLFSTPQDKQHTLPSCVAAQNSDLYGFKINTSGGRALYSTLLTAITSNIPLTLTSTLDCSDLVNIENLAEITLDLSSLTAPDFNGDFAFDYGFELTDKNYPILLCIRANGTCVAMTQHEFDEKYAYTRTAKAAIQAVTYTGLHPESWGYQKTAREAIAGTKLEIEMESRATNNAWTCRVRLKNIETNETTDYYSTRWGRNGSHYGCNFEVHVNANTQANYIRVSMDAGGNAYSKHSVNFVSDDSNNMMKMLHEVDTTYNTPISAGAVITDITRK
ncbi:hypothetical protein SG34_006355 [Thalassomonas viridans]|uniref:Uncharacterized protein n=1 Tax=Thalassomonas viridans TaxID=137584 RepID=A0AAE9Z4E9_9GAMM|nr:hypothetical protein [Thalassomonas viridans]WDE06536.1 hypothetical protein SG34_006355 [Thalassomonas viridans]